MLSAVLYRNTWSSGAIFGSVLQEPIQQNNSNNLKNPGAQKVHSLVLGPQYAHQPTIGIASAVLPVCLASGLKGCTLYEPGSLALACSYSLLDFPVGMDHMSSSEWLKRFWSKFLALFSTR